MRFASYRLCGRLKLFCNNFERHSCGSLLVAQRCLSGASLITKNYLYSPFQFNQQTQLPSAFITPNQGNVRWYSQQKPTEISYEDLLEFVEENGKFLIDVRTEKEVNGNGMIPNARNIPLECLKEALLREPEEFRRTYHMTKPDKKEAKLIFYAHGPVKSSAAVELARKLGFKKARHYPGGWKEWSEKQVKVSRV